MEAIEEFTGSNDHRVIIKGKRTKRQRPLSPFGMAVTTTSSSSSGGGGGGGGGDVCYSNTPSPTTSGEFSTTTEEEEDMANCLILLAQGVGSRQVEKKAKIDPGISGEIATAPTGIYVYECKTCNRTFPSFQALGGHRASHKKPKAMVEEKKVMSMTPFDDDDDHHDNIEEGGHFIKISPPLSLQIMNKASHQMNNKANKVHECSICGSEFSSGQALGGHMRRHRTHTNTRIGMSMDTNTSNYESREDHDKPVRHVLSLDLNLPAPEDDHRDSKFQFASNQQHLVFSAPALVDCHY